MFSSYKTNDYMPSMYKYNSSYLNKNYLSKAKTPSMPIPTSLLMNSDLNEEQYRNKVKRYDNTIERNKANYIKYIAMKRTKEDIIKRNILNVNYNNVDRIVKENYEKVRQAMWRNKSAKNIEYNEEQKQTMNLVNNECYRYKDPDTKESMEERQKIYFYKKQIEDNDYNRLPYINYLTGKVDVVVSNPYNPHKNYLGESTLKYNTITNPTCDYMANKYLFNRKSLY